MANERGPADILGKRIFFLYPPATVQNQVMGELVQQEYEIYTVKDHVKLRAALKKYPDSVVFVSICDQLPDPECEAWIKAVKADAVTAKVWFGVISAVDDKALQQKYGETLRCGFFPIKTSQIVQLIKQMLEFLKALDAKGRRKFIRAASDDDPSATVNLPVNDRFVQGHIKDISVVGFSCAFPEDPELQKNSLFNDIQIKLQTTILKAEGIIFGSRLDGANKVYVILFTQRINPEVHTKIRLYIQQNLQAKLDKELG
jgi:hypothetical protein